MNMHPFNPFRRVVGGGGVSDPDAQNYITRVETADAMSLESGVKDAMNQLFLTMNATGIRTPISAGRGILLAGPRTLAGILEPLFPASAPTSTGFLSADYDRKTGLLGASGKRIDFPDLTGGPSINDHAMAAWLSSLGTAGTNRAVMTSGPTSGTTSLLKSATAGNFVFRSANTTASNNTTINEATVGFYGLSRNNSSNITTRISGTTAAPTVSSTAFNPEQCRLFQRSDGIQPFTGRMKFACFTRSLDLADLETALATYFAAINAATLS